MFFTLSSCVLYNERHPGQSEDRSSRFVEKKVGQLLLLPPVPLRDENKSIHTQNKPPKLTNFSPRQTSYKVAQVKKTQGEKWQQMKTDRFQRQMSSP